MLNSQVFLGSMILRDYICGFSGPRKSDKDSGKDWTQYMPNDSFRCEGIRGSTGYIDMENDGQVFGISSLLPSHVISIFIHFRSQTK